MPFTKVAVEQFISKKVAEVSRCGASDLQSQIPESSHWLSNIGLSIIFSDFPPEEMGFFAITFIRRIDAAYIQYGLARCEVLNLLRNNNGRWSPYFRALNYFEATIGYLYLAMDSIRKKSGHDFFKTDDGSFEEHLNFIYNKSKHQIAENDLPFWFSDTGLHTLERALQFEEIEDYMLKMAKVIEGLCNRDIALQALNSSSSR